MKIQEGEEFESRITGKLFRIKTIKDLMVELESEDGSLQLITEAANLGIFYRKLNQSSRHLPASDNKDISKIDQEILERR